MNKKTMIIFIIITVLEIAVSFAAPQVIDQSQERDQASKIVVSGPMGYQEWKRNQVFDARMNLDKFKSPQLSKLETDSKLANAADSNDPAKQEMAKPNPEEDPTAQVPQATQEPQTSARAEASDAEKAEKLRQLEFNLEIAQGLTIHDYFALYLKNKSKQEMSQAIQKLSPNELSELLMAYRESLYGAPAAENPAETADLQTK